MKQCKGRQLRIEDVPDIILGSEKELFPDDTSRIRRIEGQLFKTIRDPHVWIDYLKLANK